MPHGFLSLIYSIRRVGAALVHPTRFELATLGIGIRYSIQLSYGCLQSYMFFGDICDAAYRRNIAFVAY